MRLDGFRAIGSVLRGTWNGALCSRHDQGIRDAIERLNMVSDAMAVGLIDRAHALDDIADRR